MYQNVISTYLYHLNVVTRWRLRWAATDYRLRFTWKIWKKERHIGSTFFFSLTMAWLLSLQDNVTAPSQNAGTRGENGVIGSEDMEVYILSMFRELQWLRAERSCLCTKIELLLLRRNRIVIISSSLSRVFLAFIFAVCFWFPFPDPSCLAS